MVNPHGRADQPGGRSAHVVDGARLANNGDLDLAWVLERLLDPFDDVTGKTSRRTVVHLVREQVLTPVFRQVYSVTPGPFDHARRSLALCLAVPDGVLSHQTAAAQWRLRRAPRDMLDLTVRAPRQVRLPNVRVHRITEVDGEDVVHFANGLRVTTPARTLFDLAALVSPPVLASAMQDALTNALARINLAAT